MSLPNAIRSSVVLQIRLTIPRRSEKSRRRSSETEYVSTLQSAQVNKTSIVSHKAKARLALVLKKFSFVRSKSAIRSVSFQLKRLDPAKLCGEGLVKWLQLRPPSALTYTLTLTRCLCSTIKAIRTPRLLGLFQRKITQTQPSQIRQATLRTHQR